MGVLEVLRRMYVYNQWADEQMLRAMDGLTPEELTQEAPVAFGNMRGSLWHHLGAQLGWLRICASYDMWSKLNVRDGASVGGLCELFDASHTMWSEFIESLSEEDALAPAELPIDEPFRQSAGTELVAWADEHGHRPRRPLAIDATCGESQHTAPH